MAAKGGAGAALRKIAKKSEAFPKTFVKEFVSDGRKAVTKTLKADTGGDRILSRAARGKRGHKVTPLKIKTKIKGDRLVTGTIQAGAPRAQWFWLEEGTNPHSLGGRRTEGGGQHPGTAGKRTWSRAMDPEMERVVKKARRELRTIVRGR